MALSYSGACSRLFWIVVPKGESQTTHLSIHTPIAPNSPPSAIGQ